MFFKLIWLFNFEGGGGGVDVTRNASWDRSHGQMYQIAVPKQWISLKYFLKIFLMLLKIPKKFTELHTKVKVQNIHNLQIIQELPTNKSKVP